MLTKEERYQLIKELGGYTPEEMQNGRIAEYERGRAAINQERKRYSYGWLKKEIHRKLDFIFPPSKELDHARYRWLKNNTMTTNHISAMDYDELVATNKRIDDMMKGAA
jgi:hypothetical protein